MSKPKVHFIGIGGIGTSALARWFLKHSWQVSGSDIAASSITQELKKQGIKVFIGHRARNVFPSIKLVVYSTAVSSNNPELKKARKLGIPVKSYAEALSDLTKQHKTLAVAGAHGKSTVTSLLSLVLIRGGLDPTVIVGTKLKEFGNSNFRPARRTGRKGNNDYLVIEADEYHQSFLNYSPFMAIITNIDREHLDFYKNLGAIKNAFLKFISNIRPGGILVVNKDDKNLFSLKNKIQKIGKKKKIKIFWYSQILTRNFRTSDVQKLKRVLKIYGDHNLSNALAVYTLAKVLKIKEKDIFSALSSYRGAWRRMEYRGKFKLPIINNYQLPITVYDDYAHHPTEIKATLSGIAQKWPKSCLICVFQPHQAKRLSALFKEFIGAFDGADILILLDVFRVKGRDKMSHNINSKQLAEAIKKRITQFKTQNSKLKTVIYLPHPKKLKQVLENFLRNSALSPFRSAIVVMMGAGDIYKYTDFLLSYDNKKKS